MLILTRVCRPILTVSFRTVRFADACAGAGAGGAGRSFYSHRSGHRRTAARSQPVGNVRQRGHLGEGGPARAGVRVAGDLDGLARQDDRACDRQAAPRASHEGARVASLSDRRGSRGRAHEQSGEGIRRGGDRGIAALIGFPRSRRHQGAHRIAAGTDRGRARPAHSARHRASRHHRCDRAVRRTVRHRLGHHEQLHRHFEIADHQSRGRRARHCRGAAGDCVRAGGRHPGGRDL